VLDIQPQLLKIDIDLCKLRAQLTLLERERDQLMVGGIIPLSDYSLNHAGHWHSVLSPSATIEAIQRVGRRRAAAARARIPCNFVSRTIVTMAAFSEVIRTHEELLPTLFYSVFVQALITREHNEQLAELYRLRYEMWTAKDERIAGLLLGEYAEDEFPPEFPPMDLEPHIRFTADDQPMLSAIERRASIIYDTNRFVRDPLDEHQRFRRRLVWTNWEKNRFVEVYTHHPKDFGKIARELPDKEVKDVIEFYYLNKLALGLNQRERIKRGKKVIYEGRMKKT
jgi:hypothetical protein